MNVTREVINDLWPVYATQKSRVKKAIQNAPTSSRSYASRVANLRNDTDNPAFGGGVNGTIFLLASGPERTVFDDAEADELTGSAGRDWFFANLDGGVLDRITDWHNDEFGDNLG
jgi:hypothetical protein